MGFGDVLSGWMGASHEHAQNLLKMDYENKRSMAEQYAKMSEDPRFDEETQAEARKRSMMMFTLEPGKKIPKEWESFTFQRSPQQIQVPGSPGQDGQAVQTGPQDAATFFDQFVPQAAIAAVNPRTVSGPTPPPSNMLQPMPFAEQMRRQAAMSEAKSAGQYGIAGLKASIPQKVESINVQGDDGKRYRETVYHRLNPTTGQMEEFNIRQSAPMAYFAPRPGTVDTAGNLAKFADEYGFQILGADGKPLDIARLAAENPNQLLQHIGEDRYMPKAEAQRIQDIGGYQRPVGEVTATLGPVAGIAPGMLPTQRQQITQMPGGKEGVVTLNTGKVLPPPLPPTQPPATAPAPKTQPQGQPKAPSDVRSSIPGNTDEDKISFLMKQNPGLPLKNAQDALQYGQLNPDGSIQMAGPPPPSMTQTAAVAPPPQAPPSVRQTMPAPTLTPLPGAGHGLSAKEVQDGATRAGVLGTTIGRGSNVLNSFDQIMGPKNLDSFLKRAQLQIVSNPGGANKFSIVVANASQLTPQEAQFAADYASLGEDINVMRAITNATGFRGKEAFEVLLGQRGNLLGNPQVFKGILKNSLRTIITQIGPLNRQLLDSGYQPPMNQDIFNGYKSVFGPDRKSIEEALRQDHWIQ